MSLSTTFQLEYSESVLKKVFEANCSSCIGDNYNINMNELQ